MKSREVALQVEVNGQREFMLTFLFSYSNLELQGGNGTKGDNNRLEQPWKVFL